MTYSVKQNSNVPAGSQPAAETKNRQQEPGKLMKKTYSSLRTLGVSALAGSLLTHTAMASDIETLVGQVSDSTGPNVTLIIDTSGSMSSEVFVPSEFNPYDPDTDYVGPYDIYEPVFRLPQRLFYTLTPSNSIDFPDENNVNSNQWVSPSAFACATGQPELQSAGLFTDRFAQFQRTSEAAFWGFPVPNDGGTSNDELPIECASDFGIHGDGSGGGSYPVNYFQLPDDTSNLFPWTGSETDPDVVNWDSTGTNYTFFTPNFLNWIYDRKINNDPVVQTRLEVVQLVSKDLVDTLKARSLANNDKLRLGLMRFSSNGSGGMVLAPTVQLTQADNSTTLKDKIDEMTPSGSTPLAETMYEAYAYHKGFQPEFGNITTPSLSDPLAFEENSPFYNSPIDGACQRSYVILLTDGQPNADFQADSEIEAATGGDCVGNCLDEMTNYMATADMADGTGFGGDQTVETFIIGFFTDFDLLEDATTGQIDTDGDDIPDTPGYFLASNPGELQEAFDNIFSTSGIAGDVATFTAPSVSVNSLNRLTNRDTLYFTLYEPSPSGQPHWDGNLKAYRIGRSATSGDIQILDANGAPAVDSNGLFFERAVSLWSSDADGPNVSEGGVAARLSAQRNVYSNLSGNSNVMLDSDANRIARDIPETVDAIGAAVGGMTAGQELFDLIDFISGLDEEGASRGIIGDPLHSQPLIINFGGGADDQMLVFGSNDGYLHFIDPNPSEGSVDDLELFSFIPKALLSNQPKLKANLPSPNPVTNKTYGMDGPITAWIKGGNGDTDDLVVNSGDTLRVYAGMRRGGRGYYGFDVSDRANPKLEFVIDNTTEGYGNLGQTWSAASYAKIRIGNALKDVLIFGGGYDPAQDPNEEGVTSNEPDSMGNGIYIADATNGDLIWSAGGPNSGAILELDNMTHSIPSDVRIIDTDGDGAIDRMYVGDMGAQVWRFDIDNSNVSDPATAVAEDVITGGRLADLGGEGPANERRFYSAPSVSRYAENGSTFFAVSLGSGYRANPLNQTINDRFYVLRDNNVYRPYRNADEEVEYEVEGTSSELITSDVMQELDINTGVDTTTTFKGWFLELNASAGEKSLTSAVTAEGRIFFTTYSPVNPALTCDPVAAEGLGRFYGIDILSGLPALFDDPVTGEPVLSVELGPTGIPPQPRLVFVAPQCEGCPDPDNTADDGLLVVPNTADIIAQVGTQAFDVGLGARPTRTYWVEYSE